MFGIEPSNTTPGASAPGVAAAPGAADLPASGLAANLSASLLGLDPAAMTSAQRRAALIEVQAEQARLYALHLSLLVAECGATARITEITIDPLERDGLASRDAERVCRKYGGEIAGVVEAPMPGAGDFPHASTARVVRLADIVVDELAASLRRSPQSLAHDLRRGRLLHGPLARASAALAAGEVTDAHVSALCQHAARMQSTPLGKDAVQDAVLAAKCDLLQERVLPVMLTSTPGRTGSQADRAVTQIDAAAERARRQRAKQRIDIGVDADVDGLAAITATLPALDAATLMGIVDLEVQVMRREQPVPGATIGQYRAAAFLTRLGISPANCFDAGSSQAALPRLPGLPRESSSVANAETADAGVAGSVRPRVEIQVLVDASVLLGQQPDAAGWVRMSRGEPFSIDRDDIVGLLADPSTPAVLRRLLLDPATGAVVDRGAKTYAPSADLLAWLAVRDERCRFPGCAAQAKRCDVDHALDFDEGGGTTLANTGLLCRRHHNLKTHAGWTIDDSRDDGSCTFGSPSGARYRHDPHSLGGYLAMPSTGSANNRRDGAPDDPDGQDNDPDDF